VGRIVAGVLLISSLGLLAGCPAKDWIKREDSYLSVEQYKTMTEVISINDRLYRVKKGEEINQNQITQLFIDLQSYKNTPKKEKKIQLLEIKTAFETDKSVFNAMSYVLVLLETKGQEAKAQKILSQFDYSTMSANDKNLFNLAHLLQGLLQRNKTLQGTNDQLNEKIGSMNKDYELIQEEVFYLNKQVNALKSIEESIHAREVGMELENR